MKIFKALIIFFALFTALTLNTATGETNKSNEEIQADEIAYIPTNENISAKSVRSDDTMFYYNDDRYEFNIAVKVFQFSYNGENYTLLVGDTDYWKTLVTPEEKAFFKNAKIGETYYIKENVMGLIIYARKQAIEWAYPSTFSNENLKEIIQIEKENLNSNYKLYI